MVLEDLVVGTAVNERSVQMDKQMEEGRDL